MWSGEGARPKHRGYVLCSEAERLDARAEQPDQRCVGQATSGSLGGADCGRELVLVTDEHELPAASDDRHEHGRLGCLKGGVRRVSAPR